MAQTNRKTNGHGATRAECNRVIVFLRYALDDVDSISQTGAHHLRLAIEALEEEARGKPVVLDVHDTGGT